MGLDITASSKILTQATCDIVFEFNKSIELDENIRSFWVSSDFPKHAAEFGQESGEVEYIVPEEAETFTFKAGSYTTYNKFRNLISLALYGVKIETAWDNPAKFASLPLYDLLNFSDCEGVIDSIYSARLLDEMRENRDKFIAYLKNDSDIGDMDTEHYIETYDAFIRSFELGAEGGVVIFG